MIELAHVQTFRPRIVFGDYIYITCFVVVDNKVLNTSIIVEQDIFIS